MNDEQQQYVLEFHETLSRLMRRGWLFVEADDVVNAEVVALCEQLDEVIARFPKPEMYAKVRAAGGRAVIDLVRHHLSQRGHGARFRRDEDGHVVEGRDIVRGDGRGAAGRPGKHRVTGTHFEQAAFRAADDHGLDADSAALLEKALLAMTPKEREVVLLVDGQGCSVNDAALQMHLARETVSRLRSSGHRRARGIVPPC